MTNIYMSNDCTRRAAPTAIALLSRVAQNVQVFVEGGDMGATRASFGRRAPLTPQLKRASAIRREEKTFRWVYMIQQVAAVPGMWVDKYHAIMTVTMSQNRRSHASTR